LLDRFVLTPPSRSIEGILYYETDINEIVRLCIMGSFSLSACHRWPQISPGEVLTWVAGALSHAAGKGELEQAVEKCFAEFNSSDKKSAADFEAKVRLRWKIESEKLCAPSLSVCCSSTASERLSRTSLSVSL
jgi:hypothetical protein